MVQALNPDVRVYRDWEALSHAAAQEIATVARSVVEERGRFALVLSGGSTPRSLYRLLRGSRRDEIPWDRVHLFWGDERYVPPDHPDSNYAMVHEELISKVAIPPGNVHRVPVEIEPPERAAESYEELLRAYVQQDGDGALDAILLGVGQDGHTASLFPGDPSLEEDERWVRAVPAPPSSAPHPRITLTLPVINLGSRVYFLASGAEKKPVVRSILEAPETAAQRYPAARVRPFGKVIWLIDESLSP